MNTFIKYAKFYDLLYEDKNYLEEEKYIKQLIDQNCSNVNSILDLGCGTGIHARYLAEDGYNVCGVDISDDMLQIANESKLKLPYEISSRLNFYQGDIRNIRLENNFDAVTSLFHVLSYQITNNDVLDVLSTVNFHLKPGGIFIFDFWHGPGVLTQKPGIRLRKIEKDEIKITRIAEPEIDSENNTVEVHYTIYSKFDKENHFNEIIETHKVRYYFENELRDLLTEHSMKLIVYFEWMTKKRPAKDTWSAIMVARKTD